MSRTIEDLFALQSPGMTDTCSTKDRLAVVLAQGPEGFEQFLRVHQAARRLDGLSASLLRGRNAPCHR